MKCRVFLRVAQSSGHKGFRVAAATRPSESPIKGDPYSRNQPENFPTVAFAIDLDIPDSAFKRAERVVAEIEVPEDQVAVAATVAD